MASLAARDLQQTAESEVNLIGFTQHNSYTLALLTIAFVIGEVSHFLIGVVSQEMARSLHYGDKSCLQHSNSSLRLGRTNAECDQFNNQGTYLHIVCKNILNFKPVSFLSNQTISLKYFGLRFWGIRHQSSCAL